MTEKVTLIVTMSLLACTGFSQSTSTGGGAVECSPDGFWAVNNNHEIISFTLKEGQLVENGVIASEAPFLSLAVTEDADQANQFIGVRAEDQSLSIHADGSWDTRDIGRMAYNMGAQGSDVFALNSGGDALLYYDGNELNEIVDIAPNKFVVKDVVVDQEGHAYTFVGTGTAVDEIRVYDRQGTLLKTMPLEISDAVHGYGAFLHKDIIYIGFGASNPDYGNQLLPIHIKDDFASLGGPISFPDQGKTDLASCAAPEVPVIVVEVEPLPVPVESVAVVQDLVQPVQTDETTTPESIHSPLASELNMKIYPNPTTDRVFVQTDCIEDYQMLILDSQGKEVMNVSTVGYSKSYDVSHFQPGMYHITIMCKETRLHKILVKQ